MCKCPNFHVSFTDRLHPSISGKIFLIPNRSEDYLEFYRELERRGEIEDLKITPVDCRICSECRNLSLKG